MALAAPSVDRLADIERIARAIDAVPPVLASLLGTPWNPDLSPTMAIDQNEWTDSGGNAMSIRWLRDDIPTWSVGGLEAVQEAHLIGEARFTLDPVTYGESLSRRRAAFIIAVRQLRDLGAAALSELDAALDLGASQHLHPDGSEAGGVSILLPFTLRVRLSIRADEDED